ncbi:uncharacterized protein LY89DRAFT_318524 [Mollisia scopiformis]|uniref:Uncharacterized protein n=1 Tax=Mollisia scopiformis TaxID=149040 RepID=A0A132B9G5_MOLSC|nr:uncharacterized protein LY89DRAFT_318524 [Mollisia scopiformis]KUJ09046.1 hypothetical protein LY89DRAFT_318524 [Mollisia scopiformis]
MNVNAILVHDRPFPEDPHQQVSFAFTSLFTFVTIPSKTIPKHIFDVFMIRLLTHLGPRGSRARSKSLDRRDDRAPTGPSSSNWRARSPSPMARDSERSSGRTSGNTSRRSSPPIHPDRMHLTQSTAREPRARSPPTRERSPVTQLAFRERERERERDSARSTPREHSPVREPVPRSPPRGPAGFRAPSGPPTGPSSSRNFTSSAPRIPSGPSTPAAHFRSENAGPVVPPAGPRGYVPPIRGTYGIRGGRGSFGHDRATRPDASAWGAAPSRPAAHEPTIKPSAPVSRPNPTPASPSLSTASSPTIPTGLSAGIPTGPRAGVPSRPALQHSSSVYGRGNQTNVNSGPRPHPAMVGIPHIVPNGRIDPTASGIPNEISTRLKKLEEEEQVLRERYYAKQETLKQGLKGWDKLSREASGMALRTELSERHVRMLAGEGVGGAAF